MKKIIGYGGAALALALLLTTLGSSRAEAQSQEGQFRLGADVTVFDGFYYPDFEVGSVGFGILGGFGPSIGFALTEAIVIGGRVNVGGRWVDTGIGGGEAFQGSFTILPYFEFNFVGGDLIQPFVGAEAGYTFSYGDGIDDSGGFLAGALGGIHIFATQDFTISPTGRLGFIYDFDSDYAGLTWGVGVQFLGWMGGSGASVQVQTY